MAAPRLTGSRSKGTAVQDIYISIRVDAYLTVVNHMAYLIRAAIRWELKSMNRPESADEAIGILRGIYEVSMVQNGNTIRRWGPVTKKNRKLIEYLGLKDMIVSY